jgi:hypothetical protein
MMEGFVELLSALRSGDSARARAALLAEPQLDTSLVPQAIQLLGVDEVGKQAAEALIRIAEKHVGQLVDTLLDADGNLTVRCGIPAILATCPHPRAVEGLSHGLMDHQFEVRSRCAQALVILLDRDSNLRLDRELVFEAVRWEARLGRQTWETFDASSPRRPPGHLADFLHTRAVRSRDHVFTMLSLVLPRAPLMNALGGLRRGNPSHRGTALEYLDEVLPPTVREALRSVLDAAPADSSPPRRLPGDDVADR